MGQQEVYDFLRQNNTDWFTSKEIAKHLQLSMGSVTSNLKKLRKSHSINYHLESKQGKRNYIYSFKPTAGEGVETMVREKSSL